MFLKNALGLEYIKVFNPIKNKVLVSLNTFSLNPKRISVLFKDLILWIGNKSIPNLDRLPQIQFELSPYPLLLRNLKY